MPNFESGVSAAIVVDGRDESRLNNKANIQDGREMLDTTTFQAVQSAKNMDYGLYSGVCDFNGFSQLDNATLREQMATTLGKNRDIHRVIVGPHGLQTGLEALFFEALQTSFSTDLGLAGVPSAAMQFAFSRYVVREGVCLHTLTGADSVGGNEVVSLSFSGAPIQQFLAIAPQSAPSQKFSFRLSDYANDAALIAALKTAIQNMAVFAGRIVTITGALAGATTKTGVLRIEFDGAVNVDALVATQGALHELDLNGATGIKTIYGTVNIDPANSTSATVQADAQAKAGQFAAVVVTKIGAGGNAVYLFAFPVGATPAALVQPTVLVNEVQTLATGAGYAGGAVAVNVTRLDGSTGPFSITPGDSLGTIGTNAGTSLGAAGSVTATGTSTGPGYTVSGAGDISYIGLYLPAGTNIYQKSDGSERRIYRASGSWWMGTSPSAQTAAYQGPDGAAPTTFYVSSGLAPAPTVAAQTAGSLALTFTIAGTLAGQNVAPMTSATPGVTIATQQQGGVAPDPQTGVVNSPGGAATTSSAGVLQNGGMNTDPVYNVVTQSGADDWVDGGAATAVGFVFRSHALVLALGASVQIILEHTDGAGAPNPANAATLATHNHAVAGGQGTNDETATVKRWTRTRYVLTGASALFTAAVARE